MKVAFATISDARDIRRGSGTWYCLAREIQHQGHQVHYIGPLDTRDPLVTRALRRLHKRVRRRYVTFLDPFVGRVRGREVARQLAGAEYDVLVTNDFAIAGYTPTRKPVVLYTDVMIPLDYPNGVPAEARMANCSRLGVKLFQRTIRRGLKRTALCIFPARWSADEALRYGADPLKVKIIPFGANVEDPGTEIAANRRFAEAVRRGRVELLFVGKEWVRKGGDIAVETVFELQRRGMDARLHVVGTVPPNPVDTRCVTVHGLLDKAVDADRAELDNLYRTCDAFILPSRSEGFVIAVLEAAAYGLPTLAYNVDGVATAVTDGVTGHLITPGETEAAFADAIGRWFVAPEEYDRLAPAARKHYEETANWKTAVSRMFDEIQKRLAEVS